jgi:preprotein translocase subunit SecA
VLGVDCPVDEQAYASIQKQELTDTIYMAMREQYDRKCEKIAQKAMPQIKHVYETMSDRFKNIVFPLSDGRREMEFIVNLQEAYESEGKAISKSFEKNIILAKIDDEWKEHLREMDDLRSAVNNATYEQKDPLVVYKLESYELFRAMMGRLNEGAVELLMNLDMPIEQQIQSTNQESNQSHYEKAQVNDVNSNTTSTTPPQFSGRQGYQQAIENSFPQEEKRQPIIAEPKVGRNDPCPCGSGKKYKQCHGK